MRRSLLGRHIRRRAHDDGAAAAARFNGPNGLIFDTAGNLLIADSGNITINCTGSGNVILGATDPALCDPVVTKSELNTALSNIVNLLNSHTHGGVQVGGSQTGANSSPLYGGYSCYGSPDVVAKKP